MARVFAPDDQEDDFLQHLLKSRVQRNPQLQRQMIQLVGGAPEEPPLPPPRPQALTGLVRSEKPTPAPSSGPPVPSLTPGTPTGSGRGGGAVTGSKAENAAAFDRGMQRAGLGPAQRAAGLGSAQTESKFDPNAWNRSEGAGGMIQWRANRLSALQKFAASKGEAGIGSPETQGEFFGLEAQGKTKHLGSDESRGSRAFLAATDPVQASMALKSNIRWGIEGGRHENSRAWSSKLPSAGPSPSPSSAPAAAPLAVTAPGPRADAPPSSRDGRVQVAADPNLISGGQGTDSLIGQGGPLPPPRPPAFRTEQGGAVPGPRPAPGSPLSPANLATIDQALAGTGPMGSLFKGLEGARLVAGEGFSYEPPGGQPSDAPLPPPRPQAFRTEQIGGGQGNDRLAGSAGTDTIHPPSGVTRDLGGAASAVPGVTVSSTPATGTQPATVTKVDPQTGGLRTYVLAGKDPGIVDRLNPQFSSGLQKLIESAPPEMRDAIRIRSAFRSPQEQADLYAAGLKKYGSEQAARRFVAPPGHSRHERGEAVDLDYGAPKGSPEYEARSAWARQNAGQFGLHFPMGHEPWHVEPAGSRGARDPSAKVLPQEAGGPAPGAPMPEPRVTEMPPAASAAPEVNVTTPMSEADLAAGATGGDTGLGGLLGGLAKGLGGGSSGGNLNAERTMSPGMGQGYDDKLGAASKAALGAQPLFGNIGDLAKTRQLSKMFDVSDLGQIGQPQLARRKLGFGL
jgi:D-alanyl-D-alanine carboxypeptidase/Phage tail lysozyme